MIKYLDGQTDIHTMAVHVSFTLFMRKKILLVIEFCRRVGLFNQACRNCLYSNLWKLNFM